MGLYKLSKSDKTYQALIRPLAFITSIQALALLFIVTALTKEQLLKFPTPFVPNYIKEYFFIALSILLLVIGIGLFMRSKTVWYIFLAYIFVAPFWLISGIVFGYFPRVEPKIITILLSSIVALVSAFGLYYLTKPAFKKSP